MKRVAHPELGEVPLRGFAPRMSASDVPFERAPLLGEHTDAVLGEELGLGDAQLATLREQGVIRQA